MLTVLCANAAICCFWCTSHTSVCSVYTTMHMSVKFVAISPGVPPPITIPVSSLNLGTNSISLSHQSGLQTFTCTVGVAIQSRMRVVPNCNPCLIFFFPTFAVGIQCEVEFNSTIVKLNCLENGEEFSGPSASYSINDRPSFNIPGKSPIPPIVVRNFITVSYHRVPRVY